MVFCTELKAVDPRDGKLKNWCGPNVPANSIEEAIEYVTNNCGWLTVTGELISEIPTKGDSFDADWAKEVNYWEIGKADAIKFGRFLLK